MLVFATVAPVGVGTAQHQSAQAGASVCGERGWPATAEGRPTALGRAAAGYFVWHDGLGWHIQTRGAPGERFQGKVSADAALLVSATTGATRASLRRQARSFTFDFSGGRVVDGVDFRASCASRLSFRFGPERPAGSRAPLQPVFLGAGGHSPGASFVLERAPLGTGIIGRILLGPTCPVGGPGVVCPPGKPVQGKVRIETASTRRGSNQGGQFVKMVQSDANGNFATDLEPGRYTLVVVKEDSDYPLPRPTLVEVERGVVTQITLVLDTGIR
jgi:hypothetical protein